MRRDFWHGLSDYHRIGGRLRRRLVLDERSATTHGILELELGLRLLRRVNEGIRYNCTTVEWHSKFYETAELFARLSIVTSSQMLS